MDALVKWLGESYGPFQMMLFRSTIALVPLYFLFRNAGGIRLVRSSRPLLQAMRIVTGFGSLLGFFYVFPRMPLVDAYAISYAAPLFMVGLAAPILGEVVGWRRWSAVAVGFVGVLVMLEPWNISVHWLSLVVLLATFCYSLSTVLTRLISRYDHDAATIFWFCLFASAASLIGAIPEWKWPSPRRLVLAELAGPDRRRRPDPGHPGASPRAGIGPGALRLQLHRAGGSLRLSVVQGGALAGGLVRPAAGHRFGPLHPPSRAGSRPRARPGGRAMTRACGSDRGRCAL